MTLLIALAVIAALQGYNWSVNTRVEADTAVLKKRLEELEDKVKLLQFTRGFDVRH